MTAAIVSTFVWLVSREDKNRQETSDEGYTMQHRPSPEQLLHIQPNTYFKYECVSGCTDQ